MHYKLEQRLHTYQLADLGDSKEDYIRDQFARLLARDFKAKLQFTLPDYPEGYLRHAQRNASIHSSVESFQTEFIFMPLEHWLSVKQMLHAVIAIVPPGQRHMLLTVIDEIEDK
ncbi:hypothetical protein [Spirosoma sp.]|uniref:hypothetical protein n=1 Tax=Spirosoma sp. TaxID=1899569 RepID=UPI002637108C|nr:hypothetical protein [Spirosoma sp.]MCX6217589.1 hypothetical protein [Spirosoma sp.]